MDLAQWPHSWISAGLVQTQISISVHVNSLLIRAPQRSMIGLSQKALRICGILYHSHLITSSLSCVLSTIISKVINMGDVSWMMPGHCTRNHIPFRCWQSEWRGVLFLRTVTFHEEVWLKRKIICKKEIFYYWSNKPMGPTRLPLYLSSHPSSTRALWFTRRYPAHYLTIGILTVVWPLMWESHFVQQGLASLLWMIKYY